MNKADVYTTTRLTESYWPATSEKTLLEWTIGQALRTAAAEAPDRIALVEGVPDHGKRRRWTYSQLLADAQRVASALLDRFEPGDRIAVWGYNIPEWVLSQFGIAIAGMVLVTLNPAFRLREAEYILRQSKAAALICVEEYRGHNVLATAKQICENLLSLKEVICFSDFDNFMKSASNSVRFPEVKPGDVALINYTSGTTGVPKGALLHHRGVVNGIAFMTERANMDIGGVWVNPMPCFHYGGLGFGVMGNIVRRSTDVLVQEFEPLSYIEMLESENATFIFCVPTMIEALLANYDPKKHRLNLKNMLSGASKVEVSLVNKVRSVLGCGLSICFGQTETHGGVSQTHCDDVPEDQAETIGQPFPLEEVKIADPETGKVLPLNEVGEICIRGYQTMLGYYNMPEETAIALKPDGWLHTGDLGSMDERGFLKVTGRLKDMIIRGGGNIYPAEIESLLQEHTKVLKAAVIGVPDERWGEQVGAVITSTSPEDRPAPAELHAFCRANLAAFKTPKLWYFVDELPYTLTGKLQKFKLRDLVTQGELKPERI